MNEYTGPEQQDRTDGPRRSRLQGRKEEQEVPQANGTHREQPEPDTAKPFKRKRRWLRRLIWTLVILLLLIAAGIGGVGAGYVFLGHQPWKELLEWSTWEHVYDLVFAP